MSVKKTGNWDKVRNMVRNMKAEAQAAQQDCLVRWGLKAEGIAVSHISAQDLNWKPLKKATISAKIRKGQSEDILVATSTYFQNITSYVVKNTAYAGVKREVQYSEGTAVWEIARLMEYGSKSGAIPARKLWQPTFEEAMAWSVVNNSPVKIFLARMNKYK